MRTKYLVFLSTIAALVFAPSAALANSQQITTTAVPASACRPESDTADSRVRLSNGAFVFSGNTTGTVQFYCPVPINGSSLVNNNFSFYRIFYRDSDGTGNASEVTARLLFRDRSGQGAIEDGWSSNEGSLTTNTIGYKSLNHRLNEDRLYYFLVTMRRTNTTQDPAFSGIDFTAPPVP